MKKSKKTDSSRTERLRQFLGDYVIVYLKHMTIMEQVPETNEIRVANFVEGYLIDVDDDFIYLGPDPKEYGLMIDQSELGAIQNSEPGESQEIIVPSSDGKTLN